MKTAICYYSRHHGNTRKVLEAMVQAGQADLIDVTARAAVHLEGYDLIGFASGIYGFEFHPAVVQFARQYLPEKRQVFFVYTYGGARGHGARAMAQVAAERGATVLGEFGCKGYDTFGPFRLVGGIAKGRPNEQDLQRAQAFFADVLRRAGQGG